MYVQNYTKHTHISYSAILDNIRVILIEKANDSPGSIS